MNAIHISGGVTLQGEVEIQGSKNAVLPILAATILIKGSCVIRNCPQISDVACMMKLLHSVGCEVLRCGKDIIVNALHIYENRLPEERVNKMRSSVILMGALLSRTGEVQLDYQGGCVIGDRPLDIHMDALRHLGVQIKENGRTIYASATQLRGNHMKLRFPSVGATQNAILAAVLAQGITLIENSAREPEIIALCSFLKKAGANIHGEGTDTLVIEGVSELYPVEYDVDSDRIVAGTYLFSAVAVGSDIVLKGAPTGYMKAAIETARKMGSEITEYEAALRIRRTGRLKALPYLETAVYPGFPTDLQSILLVALSVADGTSVIRENIFNKRFGVAAELNHMGAAIETEGENAFIKGNRRLNGAHVIAEDLRGGAVLVLAGLCATGDTFVSNIGYIEWGYEDICRDYRKLGADIGRYCEEEKKAEQA